MKLCRLLFLALAAVLLSGCVEMTYEVHLNANGSGKLVMDVGLEKKFADMMSSMSSMGQQGGGKGPLEQMQAAEPALKANGATKVTTRQYEKEDMRHYVQEVEAADLATLSNLQKALGGGSGGESGMPGGEMNFVLTNQAGGKVLFSLPIQGSSSSSSPGGPTVSAPGAAPGPSSRRTRRGSQPSAPEPNPLGDAMAESMAKQMFGYHVFTVRLIAPHIVSHNGTLNGNTVEWKIPMASLTNSSFKQDLRAEVALKRGGLLGLSPAQLGIAGGVALVVLLLMIALLRKKSA